jgi:hypothetical protein
MSESEAAGRLINMPGIVDAAATTPSQSVGVPRLFAKGFRTGDLDIVELSKAKKPTKQSIRKTLLPLDCVSMYPPTWNLQLRFLDGFKFLRCPSMRAMGFACALLHHGDVFVSNGDRKTIEW